MANIPDLTPGAGFRVTYDDDERELAYSHYCFWGRRFCDVQVLDPNRVVLTFRPSLDRRWHSWEERRMKTILEEANKVVSIFSGTSKRRSK